MHIRAHVGAHSTKLQTGGHAAGGAATCELWRQFVSAPPRTRRAMRAARAAAPLIKRGPARRACAARTHPRDHISPTTIIPGPTPGNATGALWSIVEFMMAHNPTGAARPLGRA